MVVLSEDLIYEILVRLPVKSLVRLKSVCKSWLFLISDPDFAKSHFDLAAAPTHRLLFIASSTPELRSIDFNASLHKDYASVALKLPHEFPAPKPYHFCVQIIGSCRGFLLLHCLNHLSLWNPTTGVHKIVSLPPVLFNKDVVFLTLLCGFGFDPSTDDYLVVQASYCPADHAKRLEFFSFRANAWKEIEVTHFPYTYFSYGRNNNSMVDHQFGLLFNGALHWLAFSNLVLMNVTIVFDLKKRSFSEMHLPVEFDYENLNFCHLRVLGESPCLCAVVGCSSWTKIWMMREYKEQTSWIKTLVISIDDFPIRSFVPVCSTKNGDIVGTNDRAGLTKYNHKGQLQEHRTYCDGLYRSEVAVYTESLLSVTCE